MMITILLNYIDVNNNMITTTQCSHCEHLQYVSWSGVYLFEVYKIFVGVFMIYNAFSHCKVVDSLLFQ